jgi:2-oxo-4-hydroxy-4-carboxy-5-ureidoimidazoline decarboxylase
MPAATPPVAPLTLALLNSLDEEAFVVALSGVFEHSPWVARTAWRRQPFQSIADIHLAFEEAVRNAGAERQLALVRAHPLLAGREAADGELTAESAREQASAGLSRLSPENLARLTVLNAAYGERFGFPMVICVREHTTSSILAWGEHRLQRSPEEELQTALLEIAKIAHLRLDDLVAAA